MASGAVGTVFSVSNMAEAGTGYNPAKEIMFQGDDKTYREHNQIVNSINVNTVITGGVQLAQDMAVNQAQQAKEEIGGISKKSLSNVEARKWYLDQEQKITEQIDKNLSVKEQAKQAFELRNQYRTQARELMKDQELAASLNITDPNRTWEEIVQRQIEKGYAGDDIYKQIIESSQRSRTAVNQQLGLE